MEKIEVSQEEKQAIIDYYTNKLIELESKSIYYRSLILKLKGEDAVAKVVREDGNKTIFNTDEEKQVNVFDVFKENTEKKSIPRQNWKFLALNALKELDKLSTTPELYDHIIKKKTILEGYDKTVVVSKISNALSGLNSKKTIDRVKNYLGRGYFWTLPSWYVDGEIKQNYKDEILDRYGVDESSLFGDFNE